MARERGYDENLAYGEDEKTRGYGGQGGDRGIIGDAFRKLKSKYDQSSFSQQQQGSTAQQYYGGSQHNTNLPISGVAQQASGQTNTNSPHFSGGQQSYGQTDYYQTGQPAYGGGNSQDQQPDVISKIFGGLQGTIHNIGTDVAGLLGAPYPTQLPGQTGSYYQQGVQGDRYGSFASETHGNDVKWYVDGCGYMWAISQALEGARDSIWILDWWLSPELYLRRPPATNEQWRLDRVLARAAARGVKVNIIVYEEVTQVLTRQYISPIVPDYLHSLLPSSIDPITSTMVRMGLFAATKSLEYVEERYPLIAPPITVSSNHTRAALEALHPNISVMRHPDHYLDAKTVESSLKSSFAGLNLDAAGASRLGADALKAVYGFEHDTILFWAHHEKLCIVDNAMLFMGGLDLCFGRWDLNQHPIADAHPGDLKEILFPGQDFNNTRVMDFSNVDHPFQNKLDRTRSSRMGWSDISICLTGPSMQDLRRHFVDRWNFIYDSKYAAGGDPRYFRLSLGGGFTNPYHGTTGQSPQPSQANLQPPSSYYPNSQQFAPPPGHETHSQPTWQSTSRPHSPQPPYQQQQDSYSSTTGQYQQYQPATSYGPTQSSPYYPPPPPGDPPSQPHVGQNFPSQSGQSSQPSTTFSPPLPAGMNEPPPPHYSEHDPTSQSHEYSPYVSPNTTEKPQYTSYSSQSASQTPYFPPPPPESSRGFDGQNENQYESYGNERSIGGRVESYRTDGRNLGHELSSIGNMLGTHLQNRIQYARGALIGGTDHYGRPLGQPMPVMNTQVVRSCSMWSNGTPTEHSIQEAYIEVIRSARHFIYIENQFFITATGQNQKPVENQIGRALVDRILQAARNGEKFKVMVLIPSVPAFPGDLMDEKSLGTRAIMDYQYKSINRGNDSIMQLIAAAGYNPMDYIRFYNLRNYDRINAGRTMTQAERQSGVSYEDARKYHDDYVGSGYGGHGEGTGISSNQNQSSDQYQQYQRAAKAVSGPKTGRWDSVSECYMLGGTDIRNVPWEGPGELSETDAFVSEELYIHSKVMIADDRTVICGSANLNDRSMLGTHDSEIALVISDPTTVDSTMDGRPWQASRFATSLRRQLFRKHLGLLQPQDPQKPDANFAPVGVVNNYDWGSPEDHVVSDPLSDTFQSLWNSRARKNTEVFRKVFHCVPDDNVTTWGEYKEFFSYRFNGSTTKVDGQDVKQPAKYEWGHVVTENFPGGAKEVKDCLSEVQGTLVEMPLVFLEHEDIARQGISLNAFTEQIYT